MTKCEFDGCKTIAIYNIKGEKKGRFCSKHKEPNMIDVKNKKCEFDGCQIEPTYNIKGEKKTRFCSKHKEKNMVNVKTKTCDFDGCETIPVYNIKGEKKEQREKKLVDYTKWVMKHSPTDNGVFSDVLYLFYDDYDATNQVWHTIIKL